MACGEVCLYLENAFLMTPLSSKEIDAVVDSSNSNSAPGPDGFLVTFFKKFLSVLKSLVHVVIQGFCLGSVDISRLNYAILSLIPKSKVLVLFASLGPLF